MESEVIQEVAAEKQPPKQYYVYYGVQGDITHITKNTQNKNTQNKTEKPQRNAKTGQYPSEPGWGTQTQNAHTQGLRRPNYPNAHTHTRAGRPPHLHY